MFKKKEDAVVVSHLEYSKNMKNILDMIDRYNKKFDALSDKVKNLEKKIGEQSSILMKLCPHENVEYGVEDSGCYTWGLAYNATCKDCGRVIVYQYKIDWLKDQKKSIDKEIKAMDARKKKKNGCREN